MTGLLLVLGTGPTKTPGNRGQVGSAERLADQPGDDFRIGQALLLHLLNQAPDALHPIHPQVVGPARALRMVPA